MKQTFLAIAALLLSVVTAIANDGVYYTSGNQLVPLQETTISVQKEILTLNISNHRFATVDVYYEFMNPEAASKTVLMGFEADPPYNADWVFNPSGVNSYIHDFSVEMNGTKLSHRNAVATIDGQFAPIDTKQWMVDKENEMYVVRKDDPDVILENYAYVYYFNATFKPGKNIIHHTYRFDMSMTVGTSYELPYKLSPAARWANKRIDDFTLNIITNNPKHFIIQKSVLPFRPDMTACKGKVRTNSHYDTEYWEMAMRSGTLTFHATNFTPSKENEFHLCSADMMYTFEENAPFGAYYDRNNDVSNSGMYHEYNLQPALLKRVCKNLPYAHRGHVFKDPTLRKYFESLFWYMPDPSYKDSTSDFTETDWEYVKRGK